MNKQKYLFIDRDGTLIFEPEDKQIDTYEKFELLPDVIPALLKLQRAGYHLVMVTNQNGIGRPSFPQAAFDGPQALLMQILTSQGIAFEAVFVCPHLPEDECDCRKPKVGLVRDYIKRDDIDRQRSYVIGDRVTDLELAQNMGVQGLRYTDDMQWPQIVNAILNVDRTAHIERKTKETVVDVHVNLDQTAPLTINTGIGFYDHMLEQLAKHGGFSLQCEVKGDLHIDEHHTVEDTAIALGSAIKEALGNKQGITRYGFLLPMDEAHTQLALDLSGRPFCDFKATFKRDSVGKFPTELVAHFYRSFADQLGATLHVNIEGNDTHHMIESSFKALGRALRMACRQESDDLPSTKGVL